MNKELSETLKLYSYGSHADFLKHLADSSKETIIATFTDLLTMYMNDRNSSTLREFLTVTLAGYSHNMEKIGFNGYKHSTAGKSIACEAKPKNINTGDYEVYAKKLRATKPALLNGAGNYTDYTFTRLKRDRGENPNILVSGFVDGHLLYILEFPFNTPTFIKNLKRQLFRRFPAGKDRVGEFLRSANFSFKDYAGAKELRAVYIASKKFLSDHKKYINKSFLGFLEKYAK